MATAPSAMRCPLCKTSMRNHEALLLAKRSFFYRNKEIVLSGTEAVALRKLYSNLGNVVVFSEDYRTPNAMHQALRSLRKKIHEETPYRITNYKGEGYMLERVAV